MADNKEPATFVQNIFLNHLSAFPSLLKITVLKEAGRQTQFQGWPSLPKGKEIRAAGIARGNDRLAGLTPTKRALRSHIPFFHPQQAGG